MGYVTQTTPQYKTFVKRALVESLQAAWAGHPDPTVAKAKVAIDFTEDDFKLPAVIIKFYESKLPNAGVGHYEWLPFPITADVTNPATLFIAYQHRMYKGDIEFEIFGVSSADRDILSDALIEVLAMPEVSGPGQHFLNRFYNGLQSTPYGQWHFPTLNLDEITGFGEQTQLAPWNPEDQLVYQTAYRVQIFGEFYSYTPAQATPTGVISEVDVYPWIPGMDPDPSVAPSSAYLKFKGWPPGTTTI